MFIPELELYAIILWFHPKTQVLTNCHQKNICQLHVPFLCTTATETKLRIFQFTFLHRRIATNDLLLKIGKKETHPCSFCADSPETRTHLFWEFRLTQTFWNKLMFRRGPLKILIWRTSLPSHQLFSSAWLTSLTIQFTPTPISLYR